MHAEVLLLLHTKFGDSMETLPSFKTKHSAQTLLLLYVLNGKSEQFLGKRIPAYLKDIFKFKLLNAWS
jgi:hypothetical protein